MGNGIQIRTNQVPIGRPFVVNHAGIRAAGIQKPLDQPPPCIPRHIISRLPPVHVKGVFVVLLWSESRIVRETHDVRSLSSSREATLRFRQHPVSPESVYRRGHPLRGLQNGPGQHSKVKEESLSAVELPSMPRVEPSSELVANGEHDVDGGPLLSCKLE